MGDMSCNCPLSHNDGKGTVWQKRSWEALSSQTWVYIPLFACWATLTTSNGFNTRASVTPATPPARQYTWNIKYRVEWQHTYMRETTSYSNPRSDFNVHEVASIHCYASLCDCAGYFWVLNLLGHCETTNVRRISINLSFTYIWQRETVNMNEFLLTLLIRKEFCGSFRQSSKKRG